MAWYQSPQEQSQWKKMIQNPNLTIIEILDSEEFATQLIKHQNQDIYAWIEKKHKYFFEELLIRCLTLPRQNDSNQRKYKEPTQAIALLCIILDLLSSAPNGQPNNGTQLSAGSIGGSMMGMNNVGRPISQEIMTCVVEMMFSLYSENDAEKLMGTLIPGYFFKIFQCLNRSHPHVLANVLRTTQRNKLQKLLNQHGQFEQVVECIKCVLIVFINKSAICTNLQGSITFPNTPMVYAAPTPQSTNQSNHPIQAKSRLLNTIFSRMKQYKKICDPLIIQNISVVLLQIIKNMNLIFQGSLLADYICQTQNVQIYFEIALCNYKIFVEEGLQCQIKCMELLKYCLNAMAPFDRVNLLPKFQQIIKNIMQTLKPSLRTNAYLQLINQWIAIESSQNVQVGGNVLSLSGSRGSGLGSSFSNNASPNSKPVALSPQIQKILTSHKLFKHLLQLCVKCQNNNIFHQRVSAFMLTVFKAQNHNIINFIFRENEIISQTIFNISNFKQNPYFGYFIDIIQCYTTRRIETPIVNQVIQSSSKVWEKFYIDILQPHVLLKNKNRLGEMEGVPDQKQIQYSVVKCAQKRNLETQKPVHQALPKSIDIQQKVPQIKFPIQQDTPSQNLLKQNQVDAKVENPLYQDNFNNQQTNVNATNVQKQQTDSKLKEQSSFQNFLKRKMDETNPLVQQRKKSKSRTPSKMMTGAESKRKKWGAQVQSLYPLPIKTQIGKTPNSMKAVQNPQPQVEIKIKRISIQKLSRQKMPKYTKERRMNAENDGNLMRWLERSKQSLKGIR